MMNTPRIDCTGSNSRPEPAPLDGSTATGKPLRSALFGVLALCSLSMVTAFSGAANAQAVPPAYLGMSNDDDCVTVQRSATSMSIVNDCTLPVRVIRSSYGNTSCNSAASKITLAAKNPPTDGGSVNIEDTSRSQYCIEYDPGNANNPLTHQHDSGYDTCEDSHPLGTFTTCLSANGRAAEFLVTKRQKINAESTDVSGEVVNAITIYEGGRTPGPGINDPKSSSFNVKLNKDPGQGNSVIVTVATSDSGAASLSGSQLTLNGGNGGSWNTGTAVTVTAADDADGTDESVTITLSASGIDNTTITVTVSDDDESIVTTPSTLTVTEGSNGTFGVKLGTPPASSATISVTSSDTSAATVSHATLTFDTLNYNEDQMVTVTGAQDANGTDASVTVTVAATSGYGTGSNKMVSVDVEDDDGEIEPSFSSLTVTEGSNGTFTVKLGAPPASSATISVTSSDTSAATVSPATLTFSSTNSAMPQTVTVTGAQDANRTDTSATVTLSATSGYRAGNETVSITVEDDDLPPGKINVGGIADLEEGGGSKTLSVSLSLDDSQATIDDDVVINLSSDNSDVTFSGSPLTFTNANKSSSQNVTVSAASDADLIDDFAIITLTPTATSGADLGTVTALVLVADDDDDNDDVRKSAHLCVGVGDASSTGVTYTNGCNKEVQIFGRRITGAANTCGERKTDFASSSPQSVLNSAREKYCIQYKDEQDRYDSGYKSCEAINGCLEADTTEEIYAQPLPTGTLTLGAFSTDDDPFDEGGTATMSVSLNLDDTQATIDDVVVRFTSSNSDVTISPSSRTFTQDNWSSVQSVTLTAAQDNDIDDDSFTITAKPDNDSGVFVLETTQTGTVDDDDTPAIEVSSAAVNINEGGNTGSFTVKLGSDPGGAVTVSVTNGDPGAMTVAPTTLNFTSSNHDTPQTVTVVAEEDDDGRDESVDITLSATSGYDDAPDVTKTIAIDDDEEIEFNLTDTTLTVVEGRSNTFGVRPATPPSQDFTLRVTSSDSTLSIDTDPDMAGTQDTIRFDASGQTYPWNQYRTVTVSAAHDADYNDESITVTITAAGGNYDYAGKTASVAVTVDDDEALQIPASMCLRTERRGDYFYIKRTDTAGCLKDAFWIRGSTTTSNFACKIQGSDKIQRNIWSHQDEIQVSPGSTNRTSPATFCYQYHDRAKQKATGYLGCPHPDQIPCGSGRNHIGTFPDRHDGSIHLSGDPFFITEGTTANINIRLDSLRVPDTADGDIMVSVSIDNSELMIDTDPDEAGNQSVLAFAPATRKINQRVKITSTADADGTNDVGVLTVKVTGPDSFVAPERKIEVIVNDDERPTGSMVVTGGTTISLTEGSPTVETFDVHLTSASAPDGDTPVMITVDNSVVMIDTDPDTSENQNILTFTSANYQTPQTVSVFAGLDDDTSDENFTLTLSAIKGAVVLQDVTKTGTVAEPPAGRMIVLPQPTFTFREGFDETVTVRLSEQPTSSTSTVRITKTNNDLTIDTDPDRGGNQDTLTFTRDNYDVDQSVKVIVGRDDDHHNDRDTLSFEFTGGLNLPDLTVPATITEPPAGSIVVNPSTELKIDEGSSKTIGVKLSTAPNTDVTIKIHKKHGSDLDIDTKADENGNQDTLTFTVENYNVVQPVVITARGHLNNSQGSEETLSFRVERKPGFNTTETTLDVELIDTNVPSGTIVVTPSNFAVHEGFSGSFNVTLNRRPSRDVIVDMTLNKIHSGVTLSHSSLTFTPADYRTAQTVTVSAAQDSDSDSDTNTLVFAATGGIRAPNLIMVFNIYDDELPPDPAHLCVGYYALSNNGGIGFGGHDRDGRSRFTCTAGNVRVHVNYQVSGSCTPQSQEIGPGADGGHEFSVQSSAINWCAEYSNSETQRQSGFEACRTLACPGTDDSGLAREIGSEIEARGIEVSVDSIEMDELERRDFDVRLRSDPTLPVTIYLTSSDPSVSLAPRSLFFNRGDWFNDQTVTVTSEGDRDSDDHEGQISLVAVGGNYHELSLSFPLKVIDSESTVAPDPNDPLYWPVKTHAFAIPPVTAQDQATVRIRCRQESPCIVYLDCSDQTNGSYYRGILSARGQPVATIRAWGARTLDAEDIVSITGRSWEGRGRLACALRSQGKISSQIWTRSGEGVLVNNSDAIRSARIDGSNRADIESIPAPGSQDDTNFRIRCAAGLGEHCTGTTFACYGDDGTMHEGTIGTIRRSSVRHLKTSELSDIIDHRWQGMGLSCEVASDQPFTVQVLTRTGGGGALVNNSASGN